MPTSTSSIHSELLWALTTRVNPQQDVVIIPGTHNHAMDASLPELGAPGTPLWQRLGSKMLIDATIPPPADAEARAMFERIRPHNPQLRLEDFAAAESLRLVQALSPLLLRLEAAALIIRP